MSHNCIVNVVSCHFRCLACLDNCKQCTTSDACDQCNDGYCYDEVNLTCRGQSVIHAECIHMYIIEIDR